MSVKPKFRRFAWIAGITVIAVGMILAGVVAFGVAPAPAPLASLNEAFAHMDSTGLPPLSRYRARDGAMLAYRAYLGEGPQVAVLIHGSAGQGQQMNGVARMLNSAGVSVYVPDVRGHGSSGRRGDIDYIGQLDDDLADFIGYIHPTNPKAIYTLIGFSAGGAFTLRIAGGKYGNLFDRYIAIAPALVYPRGVARPNNGGWAAVSVLRIAGLIVLNHIGIHWFDGLNAVTYAAPANEWFTRTYSYRLVMNFSPGLDYLSALKRVKAPVTVIDGAYDEEFYAEGYAPLLRPVKRDIDIEIIPGVGHIGAMNAPAMLEAVGRIFDTTLRH